MKRHTSAIGATGLACLIALAVHSVARPVHVAAATKPTADGVLLESMDTEPHRAMTSLGAPPTPAQPKPYFVSYSVADADSITIGAQYGAIVASSQSHRRMADVQVRLGSAAEDNTHGDHRNSALTHRPASPLRQPRCHRSQPLVRHQPAATAAPSTPTSRSKPTSRSALKKRTSRETSAKRPTTQRPRRTPCPPRRRSPSTTRSRGGPPSRTLLRLLPEVPRRLLRLHQPHRLR